MKIEIELFKSKDWWLFVKTMHNYYVSKTLYIFPINISKKQHKKAFFDYLHYYPRFFYKIMVDGQYAGVCCISEFFHNDIDVQHFYEWDKSNIWYAILPKYWNKKIASKAIVLILQQYKNHGFKNPIWTTVKPENKASLKILLNNNFKVIRELPHMLVLSKND